MTKRLDSNIITSAISLRKQGYSLSEISYKLKIAESTASTLLTNVKLNSKAIKRIEKNKKLSRQKAISNRKLSQDKIIQNRNNYVNQYLSKMNFKNKTITKLICSILFWGEGGKVDTHVSFINSDPKMIQVFLTLLRYSFDLDEAKFRALLHIHDYHNEAILKIYWSNITKIPHTQFTKSYLKLHTGKIKHPGYMGTIKIKYYNVKIAYELKSIYNNIADRILGT